MLRKDVIRSIERQGGTGDPQQIARFDALAEEWWKPDGKFKVVHGFNKARIDLIVDALRPLASDNDGIAAPLAGLSVADVGCGVGIVSEPLARAGVRVTGIDASAQNVEIARRHAEHSILTIDYRCAVPEHLSAEHGKFDAVLCLEDVEHVADLQIFLASTAALVRPGGRLIIGTINRTVDHGCWPSSQLSECSDGCRAERMTGRASSSQPRRRCNWGGLGFRNRQFMASPSILWLGAGCPVATSRSTTFRCSITPIERASIEFNALLRRAQSIDLKRN